MPFLEQVSVSAKLLDGDAACLCQPPQGVFRGHLICGTINFGAIAGGENGRFGLALGLSGQIATQMV
jgi:hypothetical protein